MFIFIHFHSMNFEILCLLLFFDAGNVIKWCRNFSYILFIWIKGLQFSKWRMCVMILKLSKRFNPRHAMPSQGWFFVNLNFLYIWKSLIDWTTKCPLFRLHDKHLFSLYIWCCQFRLGLAINMKSYVSYVIITVYLHVFQQCGEDSC